MTGLYNGLGFIVHNKLVNMLLGLVGTVEMVEVGRRTQRLSLFPFDLGTTTGKCPSVDHCK